MRRPFDFLPSALAQRLCSVLGLLLLGGLALVLGEFMRSHSDALINPTAPFGILSLQFACSADAARTILDAWDSGALQHARLSLYWDMAFAPAYGFALAALTQRVFAYLAKRGRSSFAVVAWLPLWAMLADGLENLLHLALLSADGGQVWLAPAACSTALLKWSLLAGWLLALGGLVLARKRVKPASLSGR